MRLFHSIIDIKFYIVKTDKPHGLPCWFRIYRRQYSGAFTVLQKNRKTRLKFYEKNMQLDKQFCQIPYRLAVSFKDFKRIFSLMAVKAISYRFLIFWGSKKKNCLTSYMYFTDQCWLWMWKD